MNPWDLVVGAFEALRDTVFAVADRHEEHQRTWFTDHVEPIWHVMDEIYRDYTTNFVAAASALRTGEDPSRTVARLTEQRLPFAREREAVRLRGESLALDKERKLIGKELGKRFAAMSDAVDAFFLASYPDDPDAHPEGRPTWYTGVITTFPGNVGKTKDPLHPSLYAVKGHDDPCGEVAVFLDQIVQHDLPRAWAEFDDAYEAVRRECF